ncbi:hypothetical protein F4777DRAFT_562013 [Nemania sp. FL0916]|nr:hypothetical protein F4777DRAFT_562013 [Nemania sp. FL0916]
MATKQTTAPWVDGPLPLMEVPSAKTHPDGFYLLPASEMTHIHNVWFRSLNAIILQGPHIPTSKDAKYSQRAVKDFLTYVDYWVKAVHHHHWVEESFFFPEIAKLSGSSDLMDEAKHQHGAFEPGLQALEEYVTSIKPEDFRWDGGMKQIIDGFSTELKDHLYAEVEMLLELKDLDTEGYQKIWFEADKKAKQSGNISLLYYLAPMVMGCADKTYKGGENFNPMPNFMRYLFTYLVAPFNRAWRFNPCDFWGRPRPLAFK